MKRQTGDTQIYKVLVLCFIASIENLMAPRPFISQPYILVQSDFIHRKSFHTLKLANLDETSSKCVLLTVIKGAKILLACN